MALFEKSESTHRTYMYSTKCSCHRREAKCYSVSGKNVRPRKKFVLNLQKYKVGQKTRTCLSVDNSATVSGKKDV